MCLMHVQLEHKNMHLYLVWTSAIHSAIKNLNLRNPVTYNRKYLYAF